jgi:hypothetical protein
VSAQQLEVAADLPGPLLDEVVFVGGATVHLWLTERGIQEAADEPVLCRWRNAEPSLVLDVMPTDPDILGFSNPWYGEAISSAATVALGSGAEIRAATPAVLVATKLCAWKGRGGGDLLRSLDIHDVLTLVDGRAELADEVGAAPSLLRDYIRDELTRLRAEAYFGYAVEGATATYAPVGTERARIVRSRIDDLLA